MNTSRATLLFGLVFSASAAAAISPVSPNAVKKEAPKPKWEAKNEPFENWPDISFNDGKTTRRLNCRRSECDPAKNKGLVDLYELVETGQTPIKSKSYTPKEKSALNPSRLLGDSYEKVEEKTIDAKLKTYSSKLSKYKLDLSVTPPQVVLGEKRFQTMSNIGGASLSAEGTQILVAPPTPGKKPAKPGRTGKPRGTASKPRQSEPKPGAPALPEPGASLAPARELLPPPKPSPRPHFDATDKDQSEQFAPYMTEEELQTYKERLKGMTPERLLEYNNETLKAIASRTPYPLEEYIHEGNFDKLDPWEKKRFCKNFHKQPQPAAKTSAEGSNKGALPVLKKLDNCVEQNAGSCGKFIVDGVNMDPVVDAAAPGANGVLTPAEGSSASVDWRIKACKESEWATSGTPANGLKKDDKTEVPSPDKTEKPSVTANTATPKHGSASDKPEPTPSPWLAGANVMQGIKGGMLGFVIGSLGGPVGMVIGAGVGAAFFYGLAIFMSKD